MPSPAQTYPDWKAPAEDGQTIIWPSAREICDDTIANQKRLSACDAVRVQGVALSEVRKRQREWLGHDDAKPLIADGHQTELYHAGVWVKSVLSDAAASRLRGSALHIAVDTDAPKHLHLRFPGYSAPITDDPNLTKAHWCSLLDAPSPAHLARLMHEVAASPFASQSTVEPFLASLRRLALEQPKLSPALTNAAHELDWDLGLRHHAALASPMWMSEAFLLFTHYLVAHAGEFARAYNGALADYRREAKVKTPTRPMPDLAAFEESVELPFWLDELATGDRTRPSAFARDGGYVLALRGGDEFNFDPAADGWDAASRLAQWLRKNQLRLSPRALTMTLFVRLFAADQFIHGIGGARYDQITDRLIAAHFNIAPPKFAVTTATMYLPQAANRPRVCVPCVEQEGHRLRHSLLGERKRDYIRRIEEAPRCSPERYATFTEMHRALATAVKNHPEMSRFEKLLRETRAREIEEAVLFDRELFYALQPRDRLIDMIDRYRKAFE